MKFRGCFVLTLFALFMMACDLIQRLVICPVTRLMPSGGHRLMGAWQRFLTSTLFFLLGRIGGAGIPTSPRIPGEPGVLVLMNHQSLLDIPLMIASLEGAYPRIVTRTRYAQWIPLISHTLRRFAYPLVDPLAKAGTGRRHLDNLSEAARTSEVPLGLFPEGTRTRNGEIGRFRTAGLERILGAREWTVYVLVGDGYWQHSKLKSFMAGMSGIDGRLTLHGPFAWSEPGSDPEAFIGRMRDVMVTELARSRSGAPMPVPA